MPFHFTTPKCLKSLQAMKRKKKIQTGEQEKVVRQESGGKKSDIHFNFYIVYFGEKKNASPMISFDTVFMNPDRKK